ncbi:MAG TPA: ATP-binding protein [Sandaracinaceae bacterium LLY-WYZ-13_1]|nr:ATP-binding protein [Sandaracinaceae bacterium LLY-WYZ-13_1]
MEEWYRELVEHAPDAITVADETGLHVACNDAACRLFGYSRAELLRTRVIDLAAPAQLAVDPVRLDRLPSRGRFVKIRALRRKDGSVFTAEVNSARLPDGHAVAVIRELAGPELTAAHEEARRTTRHAERLEALGRMAGAVAHDFNNLLASILTEAELMLDEPDVPESLREGIGGIRDSVRGAGRLTDQLLAFSRHPTAPSQLVDLHALLEENRVALEKIAGRTRLTLSLDAEEPQVIVRPEQLVNVVSSVVTNAAEAAGDDGHVAIRTGREPGGAHGQVFLRIVDDGPGIPDDVLPHVFEPFFTTKARGRGTGLGLAMAYGVVTQAGGQITLRSRDGEGTTVEVRLPGAVRAPRPRTTPPVRREAADAILLVEDDDAVRRSTARVLTRAGFVVLVAASGEEALARFEEEPAIGLVLSDVIMPGMDGFQLVEELQRRAPRLRVLLMSGYTGDALDRFGRLPDDVQLLTKPFEIADLLARIRAALA